MSTTAEKPKAPKKEQLPIPALLVATSAWFGQFWKGVQPDDIPDQMLDVQTGIFWFTKNDFKKRVVYLFARKDGETKVYELDEEWFIGLRAELPECVHDGKEGYVRKEG